MPARCDQHHPWQQWLLRMHTRAYSQGWPEPYIYRTSMYPPEKIKYSVVQQNVQPPPWKLLFQFCTATAPPSLELSNKCNRCRWGWGWGWGGRGWRSWGWGVRECWEGFLTTHWKASWPLIACTAQKTLTSTTAPFRNKCVLNQCPVTAPSKINI